MRTLHSSGIFKKSYANASARIVITTIVGMVFGYFIAVSFPSASLTKINNSPSEALSSLDVALDDENHGFGLERTPSTPKEVDYYWHRTLGQRKNFDMDTLL